MVWFSGGEEFFSGGCSRGCINKSGFKMGPLPPLDSQELLELMIRAINCSISPFYSSNGNVIKIHKRQSMNEPEKKKR